MRLIQILKLIEDTAMENSLSKPYICGGLPRDKVLSRVGNFNDVDITTGDSDIHILAKKVHLKLENFGATYIIKSDGHASIMMGELKLDFSSNFIIPGLEKIFNRRMSFMEQELISRDFTCNSMLMSMDLKNVFDPLKRGLKSISDREIDTNLDPEITFTFFQNSPNRIPRAIYLSSKLNFKLSPRVEEWIADNKNVILTINPSYMSEKINKAMEYSPENTINLIRKLQLENYMPLSYKNFKGML